MSQAIYLSKNTVFAATAGAKTILKIVTPTSFFVCLKEIKITADGVTSTAVPLTVDVFTSDETTAGTGAASPPAPVQIGGRAQAHGVTMTHNHTAEGTTYTVIDSFFVAQFMGVFLHQFPLGDELCSPGDNADSIGIRVNVTANVNLLCSVKWVRG